MRRPILFSTVLLLCLVWAACQMPLSPADTRKTPVVGPVAEARHDVPSPSLEDSRAAEVALQRAEQRVEQDAQRRSKQRVRRVRAPSGPVAHLRLPSEPVNRETYAHFTDNPLRQAAEQPVSTFSIDVDTGAYANVRRFLRSGILPVRDAVRTEELVNYFAYQYPPPVQSSLPFRLTTELGPTPWNPHTVLLHLGLKGYEVVADALPPANLVFLIDVSGSMESADKLDLVKAALRLLSRQLRSQDRLSIAVYAGASGVVLEPVPGNQTAKIHQALTSLSAGGSTNGGAGIQLAYHLAEQAFLPDGINRVLLATDGDFNVGTVSFEALMDLIAEKRKSGIALTTLGVGTGNYDDHLLEQLADTGNGNYAYLDSLTEAQKVLITGRSSTLQTIATDVKIQLEFNPAVVAEYRLIGYENRALRREDFSNDAVDAGEVGAGHTVTALYEIAWVGSPGVRVAPLRYGAPDRPESGNTTELGFLRLRYKAPGSEESQLLEWPLPQALLSPGLAQTTPRFRFAAAVAAFGQLLRGGTYTETFGYGDVLTLARGARGEDAFGYRGEFLSLVQLAQSLSQGETTSQP